MSVLSRSAGLPIKSYAMVLAALGTAGFIAGGVMNLVHALQYPQADPYRPSLRHIPSFLIAPDIRPDLSVEPARDAPPGGYRYEQLVRINPDGSRTLTVTRRDASGLKVIRVITEKVELVDTRTPRREGDCIDQLDVIGHVLGTTCSFPPK